MVNIIDLASSYEYNSLQYSDLEDIEGAITYINTEESIFLYQKTDIKKELYWISKSVNNIQIFWAAKSKESFFQGLNKTIRYVRENLPDTEKIFIEFIPESFLDDMINVGFNIVSEWIDFFNEDLQALNINAKNSINIRTLKDHEITMASKVTKSCLNYSRGFTGESEEIIKEWYNTENSCLFAAELDNEVVGICFVKLYGFDSEKGTILWIRELAVNPKYHSKGIGGELIISGIKWGIEKGAKRSFLACDAENVHAIRLYERLNYKRKSKRGQINMEFTLV